MARNGFTRIPNSILAQPWAANPPALCLYTWLSLNADENGQVMTSRTDLAERTGLTIQQLRTAIGKLESTKFITKSSTKLPTKLATIITVSYLASCKAKKSGINQVSNQADNQVSDQPRAYKNDNIKIMSNKTTEEKKSIKEAAAAATLESRREQFYNSLVCYVSRYGKDIVRAFFDYWSEPNKSQTKMRFEMQPTWETSRRIATWAKNENNFNHHDENHQSGITNAQRSANDAATLVGRLLAENR